MYNVLLHVINMMVVDRVVTSLHTPIMLLYEHDYYGLFVSHISPNLIRPHFV